MFVGRKFWSVTEGTGRWAGEETAEVTPIVSPDTRVMCDVTTENLENNIIIMSWESHQANREFYSF